MLFIKSYADISVYLYQLEFLDGTFNDNEESQTRDLSCSIEFWKNKTCVFIHIYCING